MALLTHNASFKSIRFCRRCGLHRYRRHVVYGRGCLPCQLLFIGEAPGVTENLTGLAFNGSAGDMLDQLTEAAGLNRFSIYRTNCVLCRPCDSIPGENRVPTPEEVLYCAQNVQTIIRRARPRFVVFLGAVAESYFKREFPDADSVVHPSYILKTGGKSSPVYLSTIRTLEQVRMKMEAVYGVAE